MSHAPTSRRPRRLQSGFTLIEVLVVIGIIVVLVAIALPALNAARRSAKRTVISTQLVMLETGLTAYTQDFKGSPPPVIYETSYAGGTTTVHEGYGVLGAVLIGPGGAATQPSPTPVAVPKRQSSAPTFDQGKEYFAGDVVTNAANGTSEFIAQRQTRGNAPALRNEFWRSFGGVSPFESTIYSDGKNGPGVSAAGKTWGPYIQPDKLKMRGAAILDAEDNPIAYVPARAVKNNVRVPLGPNRGSYVDLSGSGAIAFEPQYNAFPNFALFVRSTDPQLNEKILNPVDQKKALKRMQLMMGAVPHDATPNPGCLDPKKDPIDVPYLLWSAGLDGKYGPELDPSNDPVKQRRLVDKCDDLTNFKR